MGEKTKAKILLLDDEQDLVELYREILEELPSRPEVFTTTSGARAISILESDPFTLLICDLSMPKMDGLQVLAIVRRKFPQLRTAILTSVADEQFRARAYAMGVDLFLEKPSTDKEIKMMKDCVESLLDQESLEGFRGVQSKSLIDIIQMEGLSQSSSVLKVTNGRHEGRIWFVGGEIVDAVTGELTGEEAFYRIMSWKTGRFESLPAETKHPRTIHASYHALLLESARKKDEAEEPSEDSGESDGPLIDQKSPLSPIAAKRGVEFALRLPAAGSGDLESWGLENPEEIADWMKSTFTEFRDMGDLLNAGDLKNVQGLGPRCSVGMARRANDDLCVGFHRTLSRKDIEHTLNEVVEIELC